MAQRLTDTAVRNLKAGVLTDPAVPGLRVVATEGRATRYVYRYQRQGRRRDFSLGSTRQISLAEARSAAKDAAKLLLKGVDPIDHRKSALAPAEPAPGPVTFGELATQYVDSRRAGWTSKHAEAWTSTLATHASALTDTPVVEVNINQVEAAILDCWRNHPVTAKRLLNRIEAVLDFAFAKGLRETENPARWKLIGKRLPVVGKRRVEHLRALPYSEVPGVYARLVELHPDPVAGALRVIILTACRLSECLGMVDDELDLPSGLWIIPGNRTKNGREHVVPLSREAQEVIENQPREDKLPWVFASPKFGDRPLSRTVPVRLLRSLGVDATVHGFRSSFRDWATEQTGADWATIEQSLAHNLGNGVVQAYDRARRLEGRRQLMEAWAAHCLGNDKG